MADGYQAPLINTNQPPSDAQYNYYGAPQQPAQQQQLITPNNDYYGTSSSAAAPVATNIPQQQQQPPAYNPSAQPQPQTAMGVSIAPAATGAAGATGAPVGQYSFEMDPSMNPKPSAPPAASEYNSNVNVSFSQGNYNMEGYVYRHGNENANLKIHSPEGYNHNEITKELNEDAMRYGGHNDVQVVTGHGPGVMKGCQQSPHIKSWILSVILWILIVMKLICLMFESSFCSEDEFGDTSCDSFCAFAGDGSSSGGAFWGVFAFFFILYMVECCCSSSRKYLSNTFAKEGMLQYIDGLRQNNMPRIWWSVTCYHYETRYRTVTKTDANGNRRTERESYTEKVVTWTANEYYRYRVCNDISGDFTYETKNYGVNGNPTQVIDHLILQLRLYKTFSFANEMTARDYSYKAMLFRWFNDRDLYQDFHYGIEINGFKSNMLGELEPGSKPACMSLSWYWLLSMVGLSPCYRMWFSGKCHKKTYLLNKQISI